MRNRAASTIFRAKDRRRRALAKLPFEEKIRIVVRLQDIAAGIRKNRRHRVWRLE